MVSFREKTNNERTKWIVQINEIIIVFKNERKKTTNNLKLEEQTFYWTNEFSNRFWKKTIFFSPYKRLFRKTKVFYFTKDLTVQAILLDKRYYWTIVQWESEQNGSFTKNEQTKKNCRDNKGCTVFTFLFNKLKVQLFL